jgi:hypothetical protein
LEVSKSHRFQEELNMNTKEGWARYHSPSQGPVHDETLLAMIQELVTTIHTLERMYGKERAQLLVRSMLLDYQTLSNWAWHRNLPHAQLASIK